jgi:hypothetical protein
MIPAEKIRDALEVLMENARADIRVHDEPVKLQLAVHTVEAWVMREDNLLKSEVDIEDEIFQECSSCKKIFNVFNEGSTDRPELCDECWCKLRSE